MQPDKDPWQLERLSASEDPELARCLGIMKQQGPEASQLAALAAQLLAQGLPVTSGATAAPLVLRGMASLRKYSLLVGVALVGLGGAIIGLRQSRVEHRLLAPPAAAPDGSHESIASLRSSPNLREHVSPGSANSSAKPSTAGIASSPELPDATREPFAEPTINAAPSAGTLGASRTPTSTSPTRSAQEAATGALKTLRPSPRPISSGPESSSVARPSELGLLRDARLALHSSPAQALALTEQHRMLYPRGAMAQERELIAISALASMGRRSAALSRVAEFERAFPNSPYHNQVTQLAR